MFLYWAKVVALVSLAAFLGFGSYFEYTLTQSDKQITAKTVAVLDHVDKSLTNLDSTVSGINTSLTPVISGLSDNVNQLHAILAKIYQPCIPVKGQVLGVLDNKDCGTLADVNRTLQTLRGTIGTVESAGLHFDRNQGKLYDQETLLFGHTDNLISSFIPIPGHLDKAITDTDSLISSPEVSGSIKHFNSISGNFDLASTDFQKKFHAFLYPPTCKGFKCQIGNDIEILKTASQFAEPAYWGYKLFKASH